MESNRTDGNASKRDGQGCVLRPECMNILSAMAEYAPSKVGVFRKAYEGDSLRAALNAKCLECVSQSTKAVRECTTVTCPVWAVRPYQKIRQKG
jgi:hypothetical protein